MSYQCPLCDLPLVLQSSHWRCAGNHHFDRAKEGYVNLLPVQYKGSRQPGDSPEMMQARRRFLDAGHYQPLRERVVAVMAAHLAPQATALLDIGCGEGYYTSALAAQLGMAPELQVFGLDISKTAIRAAAKRYLQVAFCVASSQRLPFAEQSLDAVVRIYAPCRVEELQRTVKPGGWVLAVIPGPRHLLQLKQHIYTQVQLHREQQKEIAGFQVVEQQRLTYPLHLTGEQAGDLLQMTPFAWRASEPVKSALLAQTTLMCEADFTLLLYQRQAVAC